MRKFFFLSLALSLAASTSFAQELNKAEQLQQKDFSKLMTNKCEANVNRLATPVNRVVKRSAADNFYYTIPEGSLFGCSNEAGNFWKGTMLIVPPFSDGVFTPVCADPTTAKWSIGTFDATPYTEDGNKLPYGVISNCYDSYLYYMPQLTSADGSLSFMYGEYGENPELSRTYVDSIGSHSFTDFDHLDGAGFGAMSSGLLYGSGTINFPDGTVGSMYGVEQVFPKPASPLYVENIHALVYSTTDTPFGPNDELTLYITDVKEATSSNGTTYETAGDKVFAVLKANAEDLTYLFDGDAQHSQTGKAYGWNITFQNTSEDVFGNEVVDPFVLNDKFCVTIVGWKDSKIDLGFLGSISADEDLFPYTASPIVYNVAQPDELSYFSYQDDIALSLGFTSCYDLVETLPALPLEDGSVAENTNILKVSTDGQTVTNESLTAVVGEDVNFAFVANSLPWYDNEGNENYYDSNLPEWMTIVAQDETTQEGTRTGYTHVTVECEPLSGNESGRAASIYFEGKGYKSETPLIVLQGNATIEDAITNPIVVKPSANASYYNVNGQMVSKDTKGLVISNGKKFINK